MNKKEYQTPLSLILDLKLEGFIANSNSRSFEITDENVDNNDRSQKKDMWGSEGKIWK